MTTAATITADLILNSDSFQKGIMAATNSANTFSTKMKNIGGAMTKFGGLMTLGVTAPIVAFGASSIKSFTDAESALADLNAVLESTGGIAGVTLEQLTADAEALQKITKFSDEAVMSAQGMLLTFTNIGQDIFPQATRATLDMAEKFGMDASQAAITLGKALNDPIQGVTALRRIGVMLTDDQEKQIKQFMEVGDIASAQAIIMKELAVEIGGVAEAMGATNAGKIEQFKNKLDDMKEIVGGALVPILMRLMEAVTPLIESFSNASPQMQSFILVLVGLVAAAGPLIVIVGSLVTAIGAIIPVVGAVLTAIGTIAGVLSGAIVPILIIIGVLALLVAAVVAVYLAFKNNFLGITTFVKNMWGKVKPIFDKIGKGLATLFPKQAKILQGFKDFFRGITSGLELLYEDGSGLLLDLAESFGVPEQAAQDFLTTVFGVVDKVREAWSNLTGGSEQVSMVADVTSSISQSAEAAGAAVQATASMSEDALNAMSDKNQTFISTLQAYSSFQTNYEADHKAAVDGVTEAQENLNQAVKDFGPSSQAVKDATADLEAQRTKLSELEISWHHAMAQIVFDLIQAQFIADGILTDVEAKALVSFGIQSGLFTEAQAKQTQILLDQAAAYVDGVQHGEEYINEQQKISGAIDQTAVASTQLANTVVADGARMTSSLDQSTAAAYRLSTALGSVGSRTPTTSSVRTPSARMPTTSPFGSGGSGAGNQTFNINVTNPRAETSEESMARTLQSLSYTGRINR